jgi:hypothetical protein
VTDRNREVQKEDQQMLDDPEESGETRGREEVVSGEGGSIFGICRLGAGLNPWWKCSLLKLMLLLTIRTTPIPVDAPP